MSASQTNTGSNTELNKKMEELLAKKKPKSKKPHNNKARELGKFWMRNSVKFISQLEGPSFKEYKSILSFYFGGALCVGVFCYGIKVIHIPINNMFVGGN